VGNMFDSMSKCLPKDFFKTIHPSAFKKNLQGRKSLELGRLLQDIFIRNRRSQGKTSSIQRPLWKCKKVVMYFFLEKDIATLTMLYVNFQLERID
jgi:hypothetical protein